MDFTNIILDQRQNLEIVERKSKIIEREKLEESKKYIKFPNVLVITGIRRCGKSIFSYLLVKNHKLGYINFDDERLTGLKTEDLNLILESFYRLYGDLDFLIFDEIQNVPNWELFITRLRQTKKIILTGSNSNLLSGELATHLTGRHIDVKLFPFSFKEFLKFKEFKIQNDYSTKEKAEIKNLLDEYLKFGGFPEVYTIGKEILLSIYEDILTKDIVLRYKINKIEDLKKLTRYLITNSSKEISYKKLGKIFNINKVQTISNWISYLENTFLIFKLEKFDFKLKQQYSSQKKIYCIDTGIINTLGFLFSKNIGQIIENAVFLHLQRKKTSDIEIYYWKDYFQNEVDFILKQSTKIIKLFQVSYVSRKEELNEREINSLLKASEELKCNDLNIITWEYEDKEKIQTKVVNFIPLWKFLINEMPNL